MPKHLSRIRRLFTVVLLVFCWVTSALARSEEPRYDGKALTEWLDDLPSPPAAQSRAISGSHAPEPLAAELVPSSPAEHAVRQIGQRGIPTLLRILGITDEGRRRVLQSFENRQWQRAFRQQTRSLVPLRNAAVSAFWILGTNAEPAIPTLERLLNNDESCFEVANALALIGPAGTEVLIKHYIPGGGPRNNPLVLALGRYGPTTKATTAILISAFNDNDPATRQAAGATFGARDTAALPTIVNMLKQHQDVLTVDSGCEALEAFGSAAADTAPSIFALFQNSLIPASASNHDVRRAADRAREYMGVLTAVDKGIALKAQTLLTNSGPLTYARELYSETSVSPGILLLCGGLVHTDLPYPTNYIVPDTYIVSSTDGHWRRTRPMLEARFGHTAVLLTNGSILVAGGQNALGQPLRSCEVFNIKKEEWVSTSAKTVGGFGQTAVLRRDGKVLFFREGFAPRNGRNARYKIDQEIYDPKNRSWTLLPNE